MQSAQSFVACPNVGWRIHSCRPPGSPQAASITHCICSAVTGCGNQVPLNRHSTIPPREAVKKAPSSCCNGVTLLNAPRVHTEVLGGGHGPERCLPRCQCDPNCHSGSKAQCDVAAPESAVCSPAAAGRAQSMCVYTPCNSRLSLTQRKIVKYVAGNHGRTAFSESRNPRLSHTIVRRLELTFTLKFMQLDAILQMGKISRVVVVSSNHATAVILSLHAIPTFGIDLRSSCAVDASMGKLCLQRPFAKMRETLVLQNSQAAATCDGRRSSPIQVRLDLSDWKGTSPSIFLRGHPAVMFGGQNMRHPFASAS